MTSTCEPLCVAVLRLAREPCVANQGVRIGMVVNDMAEVNVDAKLVRDDPSAQGAGADSVELQNGCICW